MRAIRGMLAAGAASLFLLTGGAEAGWMIQAESRGLGTGSQETTWIQKEKIRHETSDQASVMDFSSRRILWIDKRKKTYSSMTFEEFRQVMREALQQADAAMEQMKKAGINVPGRSAAPRGKVTVSKGTVETVVGYVCDGYRVSVDGNLKEEIWVTPVIDLSAEMGKKSMKEFVDLSREIRRMGAAFKAEIDDPAYVGIFEKGYPMKMIDKGSGTVHEVVRVKQRAVTADVFDPPSGYARVPYQDQFGVSAEGAVGRPGT